MSVTLGLVISHLDYANGVYIGLPKCEISRLQRVQNFAAKTILNKRRRDSATSCLKELHWLPILLRIDFKILTMVYKCINRQAPSYLCDLIKIRPERRMTLRSDTNYKMLEIPTTKRKTFAERSFSVSGPRLWNDLPSYIRSSKSISSFKKDLKTYLFEKF
jgi:hypothetical protein